MSDPRKSNTLFRWWLAAVFLALFILAVPWYWSDSSESHWFGLPVWVAAGVGISFGISWLTTWAAFRVWPEDRLEEGDEP